MALAITPQKLLELEATGRLNKWIETPVKDAKTWAMLNWAPTLEDIKTAENIEVYCKKCETKVASFKRKVGTDKGFCVWDLIQYEKATPKGWIGVVNANITATHGVTFVCTCGNDNRPANDNGKKIGTLGSPNIGFTYQVVKK